jgi:hypothetical protein
MYPETYIPTYIMEFPEIREYVPSIPLVDTTPVWHPFYLRPDTEGEGIILIGPTPALLSREAAISLANELYTLATRL